VIKQGTFEWYYERFGMITMSDRIDVIIAGNPHQLNNLMETIKWERSIKSDKAHVRREFEREMGIGETVKTLKWGREHETEALAQYELLNSIDVVRPGFKVHPEWPDLVGDSTDFLEEFPGWADDGTRMKIARPGEVKCYHNPENHLKALRYGMDPKHYNQIQGHMECWNLPSARFISYDPRLPVVEKQLYTQIVQRDMKWHHIFHERMTKFVEHGERGTRFDFEMKSARDGIPSLF
jgi:hypothetical protein